MPHNKQQARFCAVQYVQILLLGKICVGSYLHSVNCTCSNTMSSIDPMLKLGLLKAANFVIGILDFVAELLVGRSFSFGRREERLLSLDKYDKSAQLVRVVARQGRAEFLHFEHLDQVGWEYHSRISPRASANSLPTVHIGSRRLRPPPLRPQSRRRKSGLALLLRRQSRRIRRLRHG